jgi:hypothetical protein
MRALRSPLTTGLHPCSNLPNAKTLRGVAWHPAGAPVYAAAATAFRVQSRRAGTHSALRRCSGQVRRTTATATAFRVQRALLSEKS